MRWKQYRWFFMIWVTYMILNASCAASRDEYDKGIYLLLLTWIGFYAADQIRKRDER